jgi:outer membrane lipoprotein-sorting protein
MKRLVLCALLSAVLMTSAHAEDVFAHRVDGKTLLTTTLRAPVGKLRDTQALKGDFVQRKHLSEIPQPLTSNGDFVFVRDLGVRWHTQTPFESIFVLTKSGLVQSDQGTESMRLSANEQPSVRVIASVFFALFTLDVDALEKNFELFGQSNPSASHWTLGLRPKGNAIASVFKEAIVSGANDVERIVLIDKRGDRTEIDLRAVQYSPTASTDVRALFNLEKR